jgi:hypothetical protein
MQLYDAEDRRLSEALALTGQQIDLASRVVWLERATQLLAVAPYGVQRPPIGVRATLAPRPAYNQWW